MKNLLNDIALLALAVLVAALFFPLGAEWVAGWGFGIIFLRIVFWRPVAGLLNLLRALEAKQRGEDEPEWIR